VHLSYSTSAPGHLTISRPSVEVVLHIHTTTDTLSCANRPILLERPRAIDRRLVRTRGHRDVVCPTVCLEATLALRPAAGVVCAIGLNNVVLDEGIASPAVDGEVAVTLGVEGAAVVDRSEA